MSARDIKAGGAYVELLLRDKKFTRGLRAAQGKLVSFAAAVVSIGGVLRATRSIYDAFVGVAQQQIDAEAKLTAVIKATGKAAGFTADELFRVASALQNMTTFGDENIINMQALLATFKNIKGDEFTRATSAALDMAAVLDSDLKSAAIQLGKALNDPEKGLSALSRSGVSFTAEQQDLVKSLVKSGQVAKAQNIILAEMEAQFGGAAKAAASATGGPLKQFLNVVGDVKELIGGAVLAVLDVFAKKGMQLLNTWGPILRAITIWISDNAAFVASIAATALAVVAATSAFTGLGIAVQVIAVGMAGIAGLLSTLLSPLGLATAAVIGLATWFATATAWGRQMVSALVGWFQDLGAIAGDVFEGIADALAAGNLKLAAEVAMAGITLAWLQGTQTLQNEWIKFKDFYLRTTTEMTFGALKIWEQLKSQMRSLWASMETSAKITGETIGHWLTRSSDPELRADQDRAHNVALRQIEQEGRSRVQQIESDEQAALAELESARKLAEQDRNRSHGKEIEQRKLALAKAKAELAALRDKAALEREEKELADAPGFSSGGTGGIPNRRQLQDQIFGSFSAVALSVAGGVASKDKAANAVKEHDKNEKKRHGQTLKALKAAGTFVR